MNFDQRVRIMLKALSAQMGAAAAIAHKMEDPVAMKIEGSYDSESEESPLRIIAMVFATRDENLYRKYMKGFRELEVEGRRLAKTARKVGQ